jgi:hypothetical protein
MQDFDDTSEKILKGLELAYKRLIEYKKAKNSVLIVVRNNKIVRLTPEEAEAELLSKAAQTNTVKSR